VGHGRPCRAAPMNNSSAMPQELASQLAGPCASAGCCTSRPGGAGGERPGTARHSLAALTGTKQPAAAGQRARSPRITNRRDRVARAARGRGLRRDPLPGLAQGARARLEARRQQVLGPQLARADRRRRTGSGAADAIPRRPPARTTGRDRDPRVRARLSPPAGTTSSIRTNRSRWPSWSAGSSSHSPISATPRCSRRRSST
jgi:hypothetical protein